MNKDYKQLNKCIKSNSKKLGLTSSEELLNKFNEYIKLKENILQPSIGRNPTPQLKPRLEELTKQAQKTARNISQHSPNLQPSSSHTRRNSLPPRNEER